MFATDRLRKRTPGLGNNQDAVQGILDDHPEFLLALPERLFGLFLRSVTSKKDSTNTLSSPKHRFYNTLENGNLLPTGGEKDSFRGINRLPQIHDRAFA